MARPLLLEGCVALPRGSGALREVFRAHGARVSQSAEQGAALVVRFEAHASRLGELRRALEAQGVELSGGARRAADALAEELGDEAVLGLLHLTIVDA
ncbi:MAG TPA: hypothetical protein RMH85_35640 [Polyangiaceae bacterium LLY-WYZ-15_(1-7)]|nr:hypothetical protein [Myxococcales bacterium]MAT27836.1 hypothetical protein [Sandaracinus sp.]HJL05846.1 hypothetical protein [Polyangiaceae bacterium LLY-WYZ-15_(1-7)]MBJ71272.1 hypothetical protein [Sandaracinus sp.]HJL13874.1 hypothetical protein [Polyangiaceae bacterium LLY-WYZ-15_(1-7)]